MAQLSQERSQLTPQVWLCPANPELFERADEWRSVRERIGGVQLYVGALHDHPVERLRPAAAFLRDAQIPVSVECGGTLNADWGDEAGEESARVELANIDKWYAAGGKIDFLNLDGPVRRLLGFDGWNQGPPFTSVRRCAEELVDYLRAVRKAHPEIRFFLLTNFPNWGYKGETSYFPEEGNPLFYGDYDLVLRELLSQTEKAGIPFAGVTVDHPYEYLVGEHEGTGRPEIRRVDWLGRVRALEDFVLSRGLEFNLILNSEKGGNRSDREFFDRTLRMLDVYREAGGKPTRYFVQSWYPHPKQFLPETQPPSMTALVKAVIDRVQPGEKRKVPASSRPAPRGVLLRPDPEGMACGVSVPAISGEPFFALAIPETIGCREAMLLNFPEVDPRWEGPAADGSVSASWTSEGKIRYAAKLIPGEDFVDVEMEIENRSDFAWHEVFSFNCLNPVAAPAFRDLVMNRTIFSKRGDLVRLAETTRVRGHTPTVGFYLLDRIPLDREPAFVKGFHATSPDRSDRPWIVTLSEPEGYFMAAASPEAVFLFNNQDRGCIHAAPDFGDLAPGETSRTVSRFYFARGGISEFLRRWRDDRPALERRCLRWDSGQTAIELRPLPAPDPRTAGVLGFEARPSWMKGSVLVRFPETLQSSRGLHFIDHERADTPPIYRIEPFPVWRRDETTGEIFFRTEGPDGLAFSGKATAYEEEIVLEFRVRNGSAERLQDISGQFCVSLAGAEGLSDRGDVSRTFTWIDHKWTSFGKTTPSPSEKHRIPWIHLMVRGGPELPAHEDPDGWWIARERPDHGVIARQSEDGRHRVAVAWEGALVISTNSAIPCLHADPPPVTLDPGQEIVWRGKIDFFGGDSDSLKARFRKSPDPKRAR